MEKSQLIQSETKVIEEAKQLKAKLVDMKKKKQQQNSQAIRQQLSAVYTKVFEQFKQKIEIHSQDQLTSLQLAKQLRLTEITDVENRLKELMSKLQNQQHHLKQKVQELNSSYQDALAFLNQEEMKQFAQIRELKQNQLRQRVQNYKQCIEIE